VDHDVVVGGQVDVELEGGDPEREGPAEGLEGVLGPEPRAPAVGLDVEDVHGRSVEGHV
jgi:hypothetical protein